MGAAAEGNRKGSLARSFRNAKTAGDSCALPAAPGPTSARGRRRPCGFFRHPGDRNWELKELAERSHTFLEAQGDVIVRRDADGRITYANDAFCRLAGFSARALIGRDIAAAARAGRDAALPDGTRMHDQKIAAPAGPRWIAWRDVVVREPTASVSEIQSVGRDVTDRTEGERRSPRRATRPRPPTAPSRASSPWSRTRSARRSTAFSA